MTTQVDVDGGTVGFDHLKWLLNPARIITELKQNLHTAHGRIGDLYVAKASETISETQPYTKNSGLTETLKGSEVPLVDKGNLQRKFTYEVSDDGLKLVAGVKSPPTKGGHLLYKVLHQGGTIRVTRRMMMAIFRKLRDRGIDPTVFFTAGANTGKKNPPGFWTIPPRPFLILPLKDQEFRRAAIAQYIRALTEVFVKGGQVRTATTTPGVGSAP